jgi:two-component system sensor histidine kinase AlgZ
LWLLDIHAVTFDTWAYFSTLSKVDVFEWMVGSLPLKAENLCETPSFHYDEVTFMFIALSMIQSFLQRKRVLIMHLSFWCVYISFFFYFVSSFQKEESFDWAHVITVTVIHVVFAISISYLNYFYFLPRFLARKNVWAYLAEFIVPFAIIMFLRIHVERYLLDGYSHELKYLYRNSFVTQVITTNLFIVIFVAMLRFAVDWFEFEARKKAIENEKLTAELNFLKAQINPHFLFNTLNNL